MIAIYIYSDLSLVNPIMPLFKKKKSATAGENDASAATPGNGGDDAVAKKEDKEDDDKGDDTDAKPAVLASGKEENDVSSTASAAATGELASEGKGKSPGAQSEASLVSKVAILNYRLAEKEQGAKKMRAMLGSKDEELKESESKIAELNTRLDTASNLNYRVVQELINKLSAATNEVSAARAEAREIRHNIIEVERQMAEKDAEIDRLYNRGVTCCYFWMCARRERRSLT